MSWEKAAVLTRNRKPVRLRPLAPENMQIFAMLSSDTDTVYRGRLRGSVITASPPSAQEIWAGVHCHYEVLGRSGKPMGLITGYLADLRAGHLQMAVMALPEWQRTGLVLVGAGMVLHRLLMLEGFRKVYLDIAGYNVAQMEPSLKKLFVLEARVPDQFFFDGARWDRLIYAVTREQYADSPWCDMAINRGWSRDVELPGTIQYS
jgi:hypothetical protein